VAEIKKSQEDDPDVKVVLEAKSEGKRPPDRDIAAMSPASRHYFLLWDALEVTDGVLIKIFKKQDGTGQHYQI
jgi:hypothetical protein